MSRVGVIAALPAEAACLAGRGITPNKPHRIGDNLIVMVTGTGSDRASTGATKLLAFDVQSLVSWGIAGALDISLRTGDVIIPETIIHASQTFVTKPDWRQRLCHNMQKNNIRVSSGTIAETDEILTSPETKTHVYNTTGAVAVDMESAAIAAVAAAADIDFMVIRSISDDATTSVPDVVLNHTNCYGRPVQPGFIFEVLRHPNQIKILIHLARSFETARRTLQHIARCTSAKLLYE
ncbi:MAG: hypothetical protein V3R68_07635 [Gammaproteobacteria bacterium]